MIKFFRQIRYNLMEQNKTGRYFKYAIGEIILVVIGILIALQINNWNQNRLQHQNELKFLKGIQSEFKLNKAYLENAKKKNTEALKTGRSIMSLMNKDIETLKRINTDSLIFQIFEVGGFEISENTVLEIMQVGQLQHLENEKLKSLILDWTQHKNRIERTRQNMDRKQDYLVDYLMSRYPLKNIDRYGILAWENDSEIEINKYTIFSDLEFENIVDDFLYNLASYDIRITDFLQVIDGILENSTDTQ
ncbi:DUF6090 family protein [Winogradskyella maritima]|uniref:DUF6090 family protein n=1 Tax=Winogradskyella maritima TaxID=1517766 RepID=A0ABV8AKL9_9FLAO|nr:DUF6090 family protein [Winogradskyella maritima]